MDINVIKDLDLSYERCVNGKSSFMDVAIKGNNISEMNSANIYIFRCPKENILIGYGNSNEIDKISDDTFKIHPKFIQSTYGVSLISKGSLVICVKTPRELSMFKRMNIRNHIMPKEEDGINIIQKSIFNILKRKCNDSDLVITPLKPSTDSGFGHNLLYKGLRFEGSVLPCSSNSIKAFTYLNESFIDNKDSFLKYIGEKAINRNLPFSKSGLIGIKDIYEQEYNLDTIISELETEIKRLLMEDNNENRN